MVLTTPEYLACHADDVSACGRIGFMVVDEAHHMAQAGAGKRPAYDVLGAFARKLADPVVLAVTATAPTDVASYIVQSLGIQAVVRDEADRCNLAVDDHRSLRDKDSYLARIVASGEDDCLCEFSHGVG